MKNLIELITNSILTDEDDIQEQSEIATEIYLSSTPEEKEQIDKMFIAICGWSIKTLLDKVKEE